MRNMLQEIKNNILPLIFLVFNIWLISSCQNRMDNFNVTAEQFIQTNNSSDIILLDVRTDVEFHEGHLENAVQINFRDPDFDERINELDKDKTYFVYCRSGKRSSAAVRKMRMKGFLKAYNIEGGIIQLTQYGIVAVK